MLASDLSDWVDSRSDRLVDEWRTCCSISSVSADGADAVTGMADWLRDRVAGSFDELRTLTVPGSAPVLVGRIDGTGPRRLLIYNHYDVVPAGESWTRDPFAAELAAGAVYARGAGDDKADVMARIHALEAWTALRGRPPFTILWLSEGMEEVGSPGLREVIAEHLDLLRADACLWESYYRSVDGAAPTIGFGSRGVLTVELSLRMLEADTHSAMAGVYRSAAMTLTQAVASLMDRDGRVLVPGFYEGLVPLTSLDEEAVARTPAPPVTADPTALWEQEQREMTRRWLYEPTFNLASLQAGPAGGDHEATVLPASARARIDMRLMPSQDPEQIYKSLCEHLCKQGFPTIEVRLMNAIPPARSALDSPLALAVRQASSELFGGAEPLLHPVVPGSGPLHLFTSAMPIDAVMPPGTIRPDSGMHGPDENAFVSHYLDEVKLTLRTLELLAAAPDFGGGAA
jgi:acetylornithine deacetylase/succinyl-diaminopimelate desuccinylase-like protein